MNRTECFGAAILLALALEAPLASAAERARPALGEVVGELTFKDIRYLTRTLADFGESQAVVLVFTNTTCPIAQKYWPKLKRLDEQYRSQGVQFVGVNVSADDEVADIAQQGIEFGIEFPLVKDIGGQCSVAVGADRTPQVIVLDGNRRLRYRGRIDDQVRLGGSRPDVTRDDLALAIDDVLADRVVAVAETPVDGCLITRDPPVGRLPSVTFHEHVVRLLQRHCQECHHADGPAPFSLMTFDEVAAHASMIGEVVADRRMPPWYAHRKQSFVNERGLSAEERAVVADWLRGGLIEGDSTRAPPTPAFAHAKWEIGEPDLVTTTLETHSLPADGFIPYRYTVLPHVFTEETWVTAAEILPSNPRVVHHCNMAYWTAGKSFDQGNFITGRVPGGTAMMLGDGVALRIPKGSVVGLQIHYTTTGKVEKNRMSVGFRFPREPIRKQLRHEQVTTSRFAIPPGASAHPVIASRVLPCNATGIGMFSHMHLRGKDMTFLAHLPGGESETLLSIPNYHYGWQQNYRWEPGTKSFPKGTRIEVIAHFDNSAFNPFNPDPKATVRNGPQTVNEMMFGFFFYTDRDERLNVRVDPKTGHEIASTVGQPKPATPGN